jgi:3-hydroxyacyl-[acyl-carrier-protein] dehydratase
VAASTHTTARTEPRILSESRGGARIERRLEIPEDLAFLDGHFDGFPVVAGVVQLRWAMDALRALHGDVVRVIRVEALKFPEPLLPGGSLTLEAETADAGDTSRFRLFDGDRTFASGRWRLHAGGLA